ncbi:DMT family transporter, partial [Escherichia sp. TWPC-MK]
MNQSLTLAFLIAAGIGLVVQNTLMVRITQTSSTILIAMLLNSLVGIVLFVSILWFKQGMAGFGAPVPENFRLEEDDVATPGEGQVL